MKSENFSLIEQDVLSMLPKDLCFIPSTKTFCFSIGKGSTIISKDGILKKIHQSCRVCRVDDYTVSDLNKIYKNIVAKIPHCEFFIREIDSSKERKVCFYPLIN
ncbi:hypothetical protein BKK49_01370 [Rodentibacter rarus]|uniref:hypothetical protein n=1 Tax=Rodentibacter rarus TaxID=1908260 RepID=UPI00098635AC|nr:hypothetical protein [Rodentibacter rarus]OOF43003.1 hypothetical protein BKK49_01370 [Rodentibacter rarus]